MRSWQSSALSSASGFALGYLVHSQILALTSVEGPSMLPTFQSTGDRVAVDRVGWRLLGGLRRGAVVVCSSPRESGRLVIKRVAGLPGDKLGFQDKDGWRVVDVPKDHVWLVGDNRERSFDSRHYGPVAIENIAGVCRAIWWPLHRAALVHAQPEIVQELLLSAAE